MYMHSAPYTAAISDRTIDAYCDTRCFKVVRCLFLAISTGVATRLKRDMINRVKAIGIVASEVRSQATIHAA